MKKIVKTTFTIIIAIIVISVVYTMGYRAVFYILNTRAMNNEEQIDFSKAGNGIFWLKDGNERTLFFIPSSEEVASEQLYGSWLKDLHNDLAVNIIIPPFDTEGMVPYLWEQNSSLERRIAIIGSLYDLYSNTLAEDHTISVVATGDGSLGALELAKKYDNMDKLILISPVNSAQKKNAGTLFHKMESLPLIHYIIPWLPEYFGNHRIGKYDILNDNFNDQFLNTYGKYYPSYINLAYRRQVNVQTDITLETLNQVKNNRFFIIYGDDDLSYGLEGYERMGDQLTDGGSEVSIMRIPQSGRMILFDNGRDRIIDLITILLQ